MGDDGFGLGIVEYPRQFGLGVRCREWNSEPARPPYTPLDSGVFPAWRHEVAHSSAGEVIPPCEEACCCVGRGAIQILVGEHAFGREQGRPIRERSSTVDETQSREIGSHG